MSTLYRDRSGELIEPDLVHGLKETHEECDVCGRQADSVWHGHRSISVCYRCALMALPSLIADAMRAGGRDRRRLISTRDQMLERFHYAASLALACGDPEPEPEESP